MKFAWKIFFVSFIMIIVSFGVGGFLLINAVFTSTLEEKTSTLADNNSYIMFSALIITKCETLKVILAILLQRNKVNSEFVMRN